VSRSGREFPAQRRAAVTSALIWAWFPGGISLGKSTTSAASRNAATGRVRTLLYEAPNVMLTRYKGQVKLKDWAFAIAKRSTMRKARVALARRLAIIMHAMLRYETEFAPA
jgi:transposase